MRKLATIRKIEEIKPIGGADLITAYRVDSWWVVDKKDKYNLGSLVVYLEIDSWVPNTLAPFLTRAGSQPREYQGVKGERLRTVKLRGQLSQGLLLPLCPLTESLEEGTDVSANLGILKWEIPETGVQGVSRGNFPPEIPKTDQERVQNLTKEIPKWIAANCLWEVTEKLEGSSCTMYLDKEGIFHACSRNMDLIEDPNNHFWKVALKHNVREKMLEKGLFGYALQGELVGPGIQKNIYNLKEHEFYVFDIFYSDCYLPSVDRSMVVESLGLKHVPILLPMCSFVDASAEDLLTVAEGNSMLYDTEREGVVFKCIPDPSLSFKAISNKYLLKQKEN
jgi:RNA ligase (TIGR02306 family)